MRYLYTYMYIWKSASSLRQAFGGLIEEKSAENRVHTYADRGGGGVNFTFSVQSSEYSVRRNPCFKMGIFFARQGTTKVWNFEKGLSFGSGIAPLEL